MSIVVLAFLIVEFNFHFNNVFLILNMKPVKQKVEDWFQYEKAAFSPGWNMFGSIGSMKSQAMPAQLLCVSIQCFLW